VMVSKLVQCINRLTETVGALLSWLVLIMTLLVVVVVVGRKFGVGSIALQEAVTYLHALVFMLGLSFALKRKAHVRVDIFYRNYSPTTKAVVDLVGGILLLIPFCVLIIVSSWDYVLASWTILEASSENEGLAAIYLLKTLMIIMPVTLCIQGVAEILHSFLIIRGRSTQSLDHDFAENPPAS
jgi:TRAP-type mannitol/chloroaromatic compound transport system permease small subunit